MAMPAFTQPGKAGVAQLVAGPVREPGPSPCGAEHLVEPVDRKRVVLPRTLERDEEPIRRRTKRSLFVHVVGHRGEEGGRRSARAADVRPCRLQ